MADQSTLVLNFEVFKGDTSLMTTELSEESITIGSGEAALLKVDDASVAELHAVINVEDGEVQLLDLGTDAGVVVDGEKISNTTLASGGAFTLGDLRFVLTYADPTAFEGDEATSVAPVSSSSLAANDDEDTDPAIDFTDEEDDEDAGEEHTEDVVQFVLRSGTSKSALGIDKKAPKVLEVNQMWGETLLDTRHYEKKGGPITAGPETGYKWSLVGVPLAFVPRSAASILPWAPPLLSEVNPEPVSDFYTPDEMIPGSSTEHTLFNWSGSSYTAEIPEGWDGFADIGEDRFSLEELVAKGKATKSGGGYSVPIDDDVKLMIDGNGVAFYAHMVHRGKPVVTSFLDTIDFLFLGILALAGFIGLMFGLVIYFMPKPPETGLVEIDERFVNLLLEKQEKEDNKDKKPKANPDAGEGAKAKKEEGKVGKKDAKMEKAKGNKVEMQKAQMDKQIAENAGVLGALRDGGMMDGFGGAINADMVGGIGGLIGAKGVQIGSGGLGSRGSGLGGGGTAEGLGGLGTKGIGSGSSGFGSGGGSFGAKGSGRISAVSGDPIVMGALDRSLIDQVIKRKMSQIRYCYQRELQKDPSLAGKVTIQFTIAKDGTVSKANAISSTVGSVAVDKCVESRFYKMQFPEPKGGGIVIVKYPFIFSPG